LLLSAVADEKNGISGAVEALLQWLADEDRLPAEWIHAVRKRFGKKAHRCAGSSEI